MSPRSRPLSAPFPSKPSPEAQCPSLGLASFSQIMFCAVLASLPFLSLLAREPPCRLQGHRDEERRTLTASCLPRTLVWVAGPQAPLRVPQELELHGATCRLALTVRGGTEAQGGASTMHSCSDGCPPPPPVQAGLQSPASLG